MINQLKEAIHIYNDGSDNSEYLRGQIELALHLLGASYDDVDVVAELTSGLEK